MLEEVRQKGDGTCTETTYNMSYEDPLIIFDMYAASGAKIGGSCDSPL